MGKQRRRTTAYDVLQHVSDTLDDVVQYFRLELSPLIYKFRAEEYRDPKRACHKAKTNQDRAFYRLLRERSLAGKERQLYAGQRHIAAGLPHIGQGGELLRQLNIPVSSHSKNELKGSRRKFRIEEGVGICGIAGVLLGVHSQLLHLGPGEETRLIELLNNGVFPKLMELARDLSPKIRQYQAWYDDDIGSWCFLYYSFNCSYLPGV